MGLASGTVYSAANVLGAPSVSWAEAVGAPVQMYIVERHYCSILLVELSQPWS